MLSGYCSMIFFIVSLFGFGVSVMLALQNNQQKCFMHAFNFLSQPLLKDLYLRSETELIIIIALSRAFLSKVCLFFSFVFPFSVFSQHTMTHFLNTANGPIFLPIIPFAPPEKMYTQWKQEIASQYYESNVNFTSP